MPCASLFQNKFSEKILYYFKHTIIHSRFNDTTRTLLSIQPSNILKPTCLFILETIYITKTITIFQYIRHRWEEFHNKACLKASSAQKNNKKRKKHKEKCHFKESLKSLHPFCTVMLWPSSFQDVGWAKIIKKNERNLWKCEMCITCIHDYNIVLKRSNRSAL